jgi:hypothetical protein
MVHADPAALDTGIVTVQISIAIRRRGGRKTVVAAHCAATLPVARSKATSGLVRSLAKAFYWRKLIEVGRFATIRELAIAEKVTSSYVGRLLRLTLLSPAAIEVFLNGRHRSVLTLADLVRTCSLNWEAQDALIAEMKPPDHRNTKPSAMKSDGARL